MSIIGRFLLIFVVEIPFDILEGATIEIFQSRLVDGFVHCTIKERIDARVVYELSQWQLGIVGILTIRKLRANRSELYFSYPPLTSIVDEYIKQLGDIRKDSPYQTREDFIAANDRARKQTDAIVENRKKHLMEIVKAYFSRLETEDIWMGNPKAKKTLSRKGAPNFDTLAKILQLAKLRDEDIKQFGRASSWSKTCERARIDRKTVINHLPDLRTRWEDNAYRFEEIEESLRNLGGT